ncbi:AfsR/SARP family transcriptional regulator [Kitasatospora sp. NPDC001683]
MRFGLLGNLTIQDDSGAALTLRPPKCRALLAALLLSPNRPVARDRLIGALWGERPPATATNALNNQVARLRRFLGPDGDDRVRTVPPGYLLRVDESELDTAVFSNRLAAAATSRGQGDWLKVSEHTAAALATWRGSPLGDLPTLAEQELPYIHSLQEDQLQAAEWYFEAALHLGRHQSAISELTRWVAEYPLHEEFHVRLITAFYRSGRQADALAVFEDVRARLREELGVDPGPALRAVHHQVLVCDPALLWQPEPVAAVVAETVNSTVDNRAESPILSAPPTTTEVAPAQLPADTSDFTGRENELKDLTDQLAAATSHGHPSVVVVSGMGGIGKTTLAVHAAQQVRHLFPDGQLYVDLRGFGPGEPREPRDILAGFLTDLSRTDDTEAGRRPIPEHTDDRAALLRTVLADRRVLLFLDNARDAAQVLPLLPGSGPCAVVVTSRTMLADLPGAVQTTLEPLDVEEQRALLSVLCGSGRVREDPDGALRVLAACAGLPLALRITGARLAARPAWSLSTLAQRLDAGDGRLRALSAGHLRVRATFASSYLALGDEPLEREAVRAFRLLGLWPGFVFSVESAAALIGRSADTTADLLELLVDVHLLQSPGPLLYRFHDLLGEFAAERADEEETSEDRDTARVRLMIWYAAALHSACIKIDSGIHYLSFADETPLAPLPVFTSGEHALRWCVQELAHIKEAIRQAAHCSRPDLAWRIAYGLLGYAKRYWWTGETEDCLHLALQIAEENGDLLGQAWMLRRIAIHHGMAFRTEQAIEALHASLALFEELGHESAIAFLLTDLAVGYNQLGQGEQALGYARQALEQQRANGHNRGEGLILSVMGNALLTVGDFPAAETHLRESLELWRKHENLPNTAITLANLGDTLRGLNRRKEAFAALDEALEIQQRLGHIGYIADCLVITGRTHLHFAQWNDARTCFERALELAHQHDLPAWIEMATKGLDDLEHAMP